MSTKMLACEILSGEYLSGQAYIKASNSFYPTKDKNACYITPMIVVTNGNDVLIRRKDDYLEIGWRFPLYQSKGQLSDIIEKASYDRFFGLWEKASMIEDDVYELEYNDITVSCSNRGCYDFGKQRFIPICFVLVPNVPLKFEGKVDNISSESLPVLCNLMEHFPLGYVSSQVLKMISNGDLLLPQEWAED